MSDRIEPCPNRECLGAETTTNHTGWYVCRFHVACVKCGLQGPGVSCKRDKAKPAMDAALAEARRLWNNLPRGASATDFL